MIWIHNLFWILIESLFFFKLKIYIVPDNKYSFQSTKVSKRLKTVLELKIYICISVYQNGLEPVHDSNSITFVGRKKEETY